MSRKSYFLLFAALTVTLSVAGCVSADGVKPESEGDPQTICPEPRPQICTMDYRPVCAELKNGGFKVFSNGCMACADSTVVGYRQGECAGGAE